MQYDGGAKERYRANDTGEALGELFREPVMQEGGGEGSGDLQQIILESSGPAVEAIETALALASDTSDDTWLDRVSYLTEDELEENVYVYVPDTSGQDIAPSAVMQYYMLEYGDIADLIRDQWHDIHEDMIWYDSFNEEHDLLQHEYESDEDYSDRYDSIIKELEDEEKKAKEENYIPMAVALSDGQRCSIGILGLKKMLLLGLIDEDGIESLFDDVQEMLGDEKTISIYTGVNRGIFRNGVALTNETLRAAANGGSPHGFLDEKGLSTILCIAGFSAALILAVSGACYFRSANRLVNEANQASQRLAEQADQIKTFFNGKIRQYKELEKKILITRSQLR